MKGERRREGVGRRCAVVALAGLLGLAGGGARSAAAQEGSSAVGFDPSQPQLYVVATSHLDTQWRWTIRQTIEAYLPATLEENFALLEAYPEYCFNFEGSFRYRLMREYYPRAYGRLRDYIRGGRWRVAGSWVDAVDTNLPSPESLVRHALYGNGFFRREFGVRSRDVFLPDCFGFGFALPSIAAHCGLTGFSTQKLSWGSAVGTPFEIGLWEGVDGSCLVAALNPGAYVADLSGDQSRDSLWVARVEQQRARSGLPIAFRYFGTGDTGGGPTEASVAWLQRSIREGSGPLRVRCVASDQLARDLTAGLDAEGEDAGVTLPLGLRAELLPPKTREAEAPDAPRDVRGRLERLPRYRGEMLMTDHGAGCYTSQAAMKRWNRRNECLADAAERAAACAAWMRGLRYPRETLQAAWERFLWHQFHDDLTGTSIPEAYVYSWNDELLSLNQFAGVLADGVAAIAQQLETDVLGEPLIVYNPLSIPREDLVHARVRFPDHPPAAVRVYGPDGVEVPSQVTGVTDDALDLIF
ncbi:MAG: alpha-mannosidase, partial [Candidatus Eisenbacteria bacterium]|nr:alpha-mannosidase [Candidatus Eisenbacteria bacterium]